jgi:phosphoenolpyruvate-protein kinase (PTS system EI component)
MVEVPGTIKILHQILEIVDFVSIGTNDLIQFLLAVDRNNPKVAHMYSPLHPAVISNIYDIVSICKKQNKYVSICGESVSNPQCAYLYMGMKIDGFSMMPITIPIIKNMIRTTRLSDAEKTLAEVLTLANAKQISDLLSKIQPRF